jgi:GTP-binding protein
MKFLDEAKVYAKSGDGGPGGVSFRREKYIEFGGPDGGNGGRGGHVIVRAVKDANTLIDFRYQQHFRAENGRRGSGANKTGADGEDVILRVPVGTQIFRRRQGDVTAGRHARRPGNDPAVRRRRRQGQRALQILDQPGTRAAGRPAFPGQEIGIWLRLKLIADAGLVGYAECRQIDLPGRLLGRQAERLRITLSRRCTRTWASSIWAPR